MNKTIQSRVEESLHTELKRVAVDVDTHIKDIIPEAIVFLLRYGYEKTSDGRWLRKSAWQAEYLGETNV